MTDQNKPNTPAPSSDSQSGGKNVAPSTSVTDGPKVSPFNYIPDGSEAKNTTPPTNAVADGPKVSPVDVELHSRNPSTDNTELGISDSHAVDRGDSGAKKGQ